MRPYSLEIRAIFALTVCTILSILSPASAATVTWNANGATALQTDGAGAWLTANQWWNGTSNVTWSSGDDAIFGNGGTGDAVTLDSPTTIGSLTFNSFSDTYTIGTAGQAITLNNGITMNSGAGAATIISPITLGAAQSWTNNSSSLLTIGTGAVSNAGFLLTIGGSGNTTVSSAISGAGGLTKAGAGTLTLSGANSFTGQLTIAQGTLSIISINNVNTNGTLGNSALPVILGGSGTNGTLQFTGAAASNTKPFTMATGGGGVFEVTTSGLKLTLTGQITGSGNLIKTGSGILVLRNNNNNYSGQTIVNGGSIQIGTAYNVGETSVPGGYTNNPSSGSNIVLNGGSIDAISDFNRSLGTGPGQIQITGGISGFSKVERPAVNDRPNVTFGTADTLVTWGSSVFNPSVLLLNDFHADTALSFNNRLDLGGSNRTITVNNTTWGATINNVVSNASGTGGLIKQGDGTLRLIKQNTYNGPTEINQGTLIAHSTSALGNSSATNTLIFSGGTLRAGGAITSVAARGVTLSSSAIIDTNNFAVSIAGSMTGAGSLTKNGFGTLTLSGTNNYTGITQVNEGALHLTNATGAGTVAGGITVQNGAALELANSVAIGAEALTITGTGVSNAGALRNVASNTSSYAGAITLGAGGARINSDSSGALTLTGGVVTSLFNDVTFGGAGNSNVSTVAISGAGGLVKDGLGTLTLSGTNTYSGATTLTAGTLQISGLANGGLASNVGASSNAAANLILNGGTLRYTGAAVSTDRLFSLQASSTIDSSGTGAVNFTNTGAMGFNSGAAAKTLTLTGTNTGNNTIAAVIGDNTAATAITKTGIGTWVLAAANTYTGATTINAGKLLVHGSTAAGSAFTVNNGATLGGSGTINGTVTLMSGATLSPGASIESLGLGSSAWNGGSTVQIEFSTDGSTGAAGTAWDQININGTLDLTGATSSTPVILNLVSMVNANTAGALAVWDGNVNATWAGFVTTTGGFAGFSADKFSFLTSNFANTLNGTFSVSQNGNNLDLNYTATVIPEPKAALLGGLGILLMLRRRR
jgi:fibronectin-binding autotransporter adhesin